MRILSTHWLAFLTSAMMLWMTACEGDPGQTADRPRPGETDTSGEDSTDPDNPGGDGTDSRPGVDTSIYIPEGCGDGVLDDNEACDDGNNIDGDGCSADCQWVEPGYVCYPPGAPCRLVAICGDGVIVPPEQCDDGNTVRGDGCSDLCQVEIGFKCEGTPSVCTPTVCGDGIVEGAEGCDDGNTLPFDGCDERCQLEPVCVAGAGCTSSCGDGLVMGNEECDDGNNISGDGCSSDCKVEPGYTCTQPPLEVLQVPVIYRDFTAAHVDFGLPVYPDTSCDVASPAQGAGMVQPLLGSDWKPVQANPPPQTCASRISDWYNNSAAVAVEVSTITLWPTTTPGFYVNRYGPDGEHWVSYSNEQWCSNSGCGACNCAGTQVCAPCSWGNDFCCATQQLWDGNPLFFPIDHLGTDMAQAKVPEQYGYNGWPWEREVTGVATLHNFYFTSEVTFWFQYDASQTATLQFTGDDDVWVFVNGHLAVDLGGAHVPLDGAVVINASTASRFGLVDGNVYRINVFHAERKMEGSSFKLTLGGFNTARSECRPTCGDGIIGLGEECDDGDEFNTGGYGECGPDCRWGPRCGDGVVQEEQGEHCDDGPDNGKPGKCPRSCRILDIE